MSRESIWQRRIPRYTQPSILHRRFVGTKSMRGENMPSSLRFALQEDSRLRRSFALEQLSTNTKSTQHQTAEWARDRVLFNRSSRICKYERSDQKCASVFRHQSVYTRVYVCEREYYKCTEYFICSCVPKSHIFEKFNLIVYLNQTIFFLFF